MSCSDVDECAEDVHDCHRKAECINTRGSYRCSCLNGYHGNGKQCKGKQVIHVHLRNPIECSLSRNKKLIENHSVDEFKRL